MALKTTAPSINQGGIDYGAEAIKNINPGYYAAMQKGFNPQLPYGLAPTKPDYDTTVHTATPTFAGAQPGLDPNAYGIAGFGEVGTDPQALNQIKEQAYNKGPSAWASLLNNQQGIDQQNAYDSAAAQGAGANATALSNLSRFGGLSGGAAERLAGDSAKNTAFNQNSILRQGLTDRNSIGLADQAQKNQLLQSIPGIQNQDANLKLASQAQQLDTSKFNAGQGLDTSKFNQSQLQQLGEFNTGEANKTNMFNTTNQNNVVAGQNAYNQGTYSDQLKAYGATQTANATAGKNPDGSNKQK